MNKIQKQKGGLIAIGIIAVVVAILFLAFGILLLVKGIGNVSESSKLAVGIIKIVLGAIFCLLFIPSIGYGIYSIWIGLTLKAMFGSIKEGNIAKEGGTINMKKCDRCGTEILEGEEKCSNCGKEYCKINLKGSIEKTKHYAFALAEPF